MKKQEPIQFQVNIHELLSETFVRKVCITITQEQVDSIKLLKQPGRRNTRFMEHVAEQACLIRKPGHIERLQDSEFIPTNKSSKAFWELVKQAPER